ncbi:efflux RND transporter periplasmic adaptor subunit [Pseudoroseicyclus aestuarii]|uniref:HlyD family secretion protein n=1 Tax=Pseudoroseicyclus aestuarii TaxID=1795041 RepID=A0A318SSD5_9RHOB|nr:HlyD family efflux transporter periplasmic adaptor subunit [Pseudoroseicyclus aestuarii]PYE84740.1 HlyD family secretion protein [Pseudoroseicyclus aestuarii]
MKFLSRSLTGLFLMALTLALLAWAGAILWGAAQSRLSQQPRQFEQREPVTTVSTVTVTPETIAPILTVYGQVQAGRTLDLRAPASGIVTEIDEAFVEGGAVSAGQRLLIIDPATAQAELTRAQADLSDAQAEQRDARRSVTLSEDELAAARSQAELRTRALERQRTLDDGGFSTAADLETAELAAASAEQAVLTAREAVNQAEARVDQAATALTRSELAVTEAERALEDTRLTAAFGGVLSDVAVAQGVRVSQNEALATLLDPAQLEVSFRISTSQYAQLLGEGGDLIAAEVTATLPAQDLDLTATGRITRESAAVAEGQTGRLIYAALDAAPFLRPGDFVTVAIQEPPLDGLARLPATALASDGTVLVLRDGRLALAEAQLVRRQGDDVLVRAPDLAGQEVVALRTPLLGAGLRAEPAQRSEEAETQSAEAAPEMIALSPDRRDRLLAYIEENDGLPEDTRERLLAQLRAPMVPAETVTRIETRMGG